MTKRHNLDSDQFNAIFLGDVPLMDVRAPVEFSAGAFPSASNHPILDDEQRSAIGTTYARQGQEVAIECGLELATLDVRAQRIRAWSEFARKNPEGYLYCFRGGLRSHTAQQWLMQSGIHYPLVEGGYKALRRYLLTALQRACELSNVVVLAGATANGKTELLHKHPYSIDLEGLANHRGSAFGSTFSPQPSQICFENNLAIHLLKLEHLGAPLILVEAESRLIGRLNLPLPLQLAMKQAPVIELQATRQARLERLRRDYIDFAVEYYGANTDEPWARVEQYVQNALDRIRKRLGGKKYQELSKLLPQACNERRYEDGWKGFDQIFTELLDHYYDKMYAYQLEKQSSQRVFSGDEEAVLSFLESNYNYA